MRRLRLDSEIHSELNNSEDIWEMEKPASKTGDRVRRCGNLLATVINNYQQRGGTPRAVLESLASGVARNVEGGRRYMA